MTNGNGGEQQGEAETERRRKCPFLNTWCIGDACELHATLYQRVAGEREPVRKKGTCVFGAMLTLLSEINAKTIPPAPVGGADIKIPRLFRG